MSTSQPEVRRRFPALDPMGLQHPYDRAALIALQRVPGVDILVCKFIFPSDYSGTLLEPPLKPNDS